MELAEIVETLVGPIHPVGETNEDERRFENLEVLCSLVGELVFEIDQMAYENKNCYEYSRRRAAMYADEFLSNTLGIEEDI